MALVGFPVVSAQRSHNIHSRSKRRRTVVDFPGASVVVPQIKGKVKHKRVGLTSTGPPVRQHAPILNLEGRIIGRVTSICPSLTLQVNVAMGYVEPEYAKAGVLKSGRSLWMVLPLKCSLCQQSIIP
ncbi:aminomethyltransferase, mitochondrial-like [Xenopus laevis]|uniref:Aminomethyltransferase, mitochondrial-like n=1 Tax=Xenopus laevis TaxID=8355 RepID=A0A8J0V5I3_XENLA|nr:aminomethyltransferase, mitochondrial-like [Xenopus laevis]